KNNTIDAKLINSSVAITNGKSNAQINSEMALYSYSDAKMAEGEALLKDAQDKHEKQKQEYGEQYAATDALETAMFETNKQYMRHVKLARIAFEGDKEAINALQLQGRRKQTYTGWINQSSIFYKNALKNDAIKAELVSMNIPEATLMAMEEKIKDVHDKLTEQLKEKGEAQKATEVRDNALEDLLDWMAKYKAVAKVAFEDDPQLIEILGIVEPS
ncbi:MAG: hypothetical protein AAFY41_09945, partial [Bacteroidota bacterium]